MSLRSDVEALADTASQYFDEAGQKNLRQSIEHLDEALTVAIAGRVKAGKSTLLNALVGESVAPTDAAECTKVVTWYTDGIAYRAWLLGAGGQEPQQIGFLRESGHVTLDIGATPIEEIERLEVEFPSQQLRTMSVVDTPGMASVSEEVSARSERFLLPGNDTSNVDVVIYLMRHLHDTDVDFLEAFSGDRKHRDPTRAIGVLSRADEIGGGRLDAMEIAERVAESYRLHPQLRGRLQTVVPVAGLVGLTASTLREAEYRLLCELADVPIGAFEDAVVSVDILSDAASHLLGTDARTISDLIDRLGLFGIRTSVALIRHGKVATASQLAGELRRRSGLERLTAVLNGVFRDRRDVVKADGILRLIEREATRVGDASARREIGSELERVRMNAHDVRELKALNDLRTWAPKEFSADQASEAERLLGANGVALHERLGCVDGVDEADMRPEISAKVDEWRRLENRVTWSRDARLIAGVVVRSLERMFVSLNQ